MTRPIRFSGPEIKHAAKAAKDHGVTVELKRDGTLVISPETQATPSALSENPLHEHSFSEGE
jgi:hypothetical protein